MIKHYDYRIVFPDGRAYVGVSPHPEVSFSEHCGADTATGQAIRRYGRHNCKFEICKGDISHWAEPVTKATRPMSRSWPDIEGDPVFLSSIKVHTRSTFDAADSELATCFDVIFAPFSSAGKLDWHALEIAANAEGRRAIQLIFLGSVFTWKQARVPWKDWQSTVLPLHSSNRYGPHCSAMLLGLVRRYRVRQLEPHLLAILASAASALGVRAGWGALGGDRRRVINVPD
jgi:hypothetical protein